MRKQKCQTRAYSRQLHIIVALDNLGEFKAQEISNTVWSFATTEVSHPALFEKLAGHIISLDYLNEFKGQNLANTTWAFAKATVSQPRFYDKVGAHIVSLDTLGEFDEQAICNLVCAFRKADVHNPQLYDKLVDAAIQKQDEFSIRQLENLDRWTK